MMFKDYLNDKKNHIETALKQLLQTKQPQFGTLYESMNYSLMAGGKRIRPVLMLATIEALGHDAVPYTEMACALECIHTYSLIHDDLPCRITTICAEESLPTIKYLERIWLCLQAMHCRRLHLK